MWTCLPGDRSHKFDIETNVACWLSLSDGWVETTNHSNRSTEIFSRYLGAPQGEYDFHWPATFLGCPWDFFFPPKKPREIFVAGYVLPQIFMTCELSMMAPLSNSGVTCWISRAFGTKAGKCIGLNMLLCLGRAKEMCVTSVLEKWIWSLYLNMFNVD